MSGVIPKIKRRVYIKDERVHDINQTNALNAVRRYLEEQKQSFLVALTSRRDASSSAVSSAIESTISTWQSSFNSNVESIRTNIINYLTADTPLPAITDDGDIEENSWTSYNSLETNVVNSFYDYLKSTYSGTEGEDAINIFKTFDATLSNYASKTVVDALDEFAKVMDSAFVFGEDYPGYVTDTTYGIQFQDYSDYTVLNNINKTGSMSLIDTSTQYVFFSDEANVYYKLSGNNSYRIEKAPPGSEVSREYYLNKTDLVGDSSRYYDSDVLQFKHKSTDPTWLDINHALSWNVPATFDVTPAVSSLTGGITYCRDSNEPTAIYYSGQAELYAVKVDNKYKRLFRWDANSVSGSSPVPQTKTLVSTLRSAAQKLNFYQAIYGTFDEDGSLNANEYDVSFYYNNDDLKWSDSSLAINDWCPIYKGTLRYANSSSVIKSNTVDDVIRYYTKVTTTYKVVQHTPAVADDPATTGTNEAAPASTTLVDVTETFVCILMDDSTSRPIIRSSSAPALTKEGVLGTLAVYFDQQAASEAVSVGTFDGWTTTLS